MRQHTGGCGLGFVFCVLRDVQGRARWQRALNQAACAACNGCCVMGWFMRWFELKFVLKFVRWPMRNFSRPLHGKVQRQAHRAIPQAQLQCTGQGLGLKALQQHQQAGLRGKQCIRRVAGIGRPSQRDPGHGGLQRQHRAVHACSQRLPQV